MTSFLKKLDLQGWSTLVGLIIAVAAAMNSVFSFVTKDVVKEHYLKIDIAGMQANEKKVSYVIAFINDGDYPEIVTEAESFLGQKFEGYDKPASFPQRYCFQPIVVGANEHKVITYTTEYDIDAPELKGTSTQKQEFIPIIKFTVRGAEQGLINSYAELGIIKPPSFDFYTQTIEVDFKKPRPHLTLGPFPVAKEFSKPSLCRGRS